MSVAPRLGGYELEEEVGRGGMGVVYRARDLALDRPVALKVIGEHLAGDPTFAARFARESRVAAALDHPNVVTIHAVGVHDERPFIAMQWIDGGDLRARLDEGPLEPEEVVRLGTQLASALGAAHARGLVHRDVKPANVLLRRVGDEQRPVLADFGLARRLDDEDVALTRTGVLLGTPLYSAPEQITGAGEDARSDLYALGCVLFEALTGTPPFGGANENAVRFAHVNAPRPSVRELRPEVPAGLDAVIRRTLATDPDARFQDAGELERALAASLRSPATEPEPAVTPSPRRARRGLLAPLAIVASALAVAAAVVLAMGSGDDGGGHATTGRTSLVRTDLATVPTSPVQVAAVAPPRTKATTATRSCGDGITVNASTSCAFARSVRAAYHGRGSYTVRSAAIGADVRMFCSGEHPVVCAGGTNARLTFTAG